LADEVINNIIDGGYFLIILAIPFTIGKGSSGRKTNILFGNIQKFIGVGLNKVIGELVQSPNLRLFKSLVWAAAARSDWCFLMRRKTVNPARSKKS
jgi:hypothetical protein